MTVKKQTEVLRYSRASESHLTVSVVEELSDVAGAAGRPREDLVEVYDF